MTADSAASKEVKFGVVGVGVIASFHAKAIAEIPGAKLSACTDVVPERSASFASEYGARAVDSVDEMIAGDLVDAVIICTPSGLHLEPALAAAAAGKHLVIEKPLEIRPERCDQIIAAARKNGVKVAGIFPSRFSDGAKLLKAALDAGRFGTLSVADAAVKWHRGEEYYAQAGWRGTWKLDGGGALMNQSIHAVDLVQWLSGGISEVSAYAATLAHEGLEVEDTAAAAVRHGNGALGTITGTTASWPGWAKRIEVSGSMGSAAIEDDKIVRWEFAREQDGDAQIRAGFAEAESGVGGAGDPKAIGYEGHRRQLADFVQALAEDREPMVNGEEARKAVAVIDAIYRSAKNGERVKLS